LVVLFPCLLLVLLHLVVVVLQVVLLPVVGLLLAEAVQSFIRAVLVPSLRHVAPRACHRTL
jgi:hypothetical protein